MAHMSLKDRKEYDVISFEMPDGKTFTVLKKLPYAVFLKAIESEQAVEQLAIMCGAKSEEIAAYDMRDIRQANKFVFEELEKQREKDDPTPAVES